eukprot:4166043-Lingulodinium_polyedra.AAC.1
MSCCATVLFSFAPGLFYKAMPFPARPRRCSPRGSIWPSSPAPCPRRPHPPRICAFDVVRR